MSKEAIIHTVQQKLESILASQNDHFLVDIRIKPTNNIKVFLDGDKGVGIDDLVKYNRTLYKQLEEEGMFPDGDFSLEVSSAGLDEPLKLYRQYVKNLGRDVQVTLQDGSVREGKLLSASESEIVVEETKGKGKKAETIQHTIQFNDIKTTKILIKF
ncbi:MAG: ribosome maturation factor [Sphingobacteriales bacterium 41-5]|nr:MAG: ribosome maturation factor [Niabella sp. SCN 42-15]OJU24737.1 MAG: ribosome maturation factor [Sphingobacteriales bacterium 41-5]